MLQSCRSALWTVVSLAVLLGGATHTALAGDPIPPSGSVGPTMKTLDQIEARTPVDSLPGSATALYVISAPGSYYLSGNLAGVDGKHGVEISSDNVSLDLNGFTLSGSPASLSGVYVTSPGSGPFGTPLQRKGVDISNGVATGWGASGIDAWFATASTLRNLRASSNAVDGIRLGDGECEHCLSSNNGDDGFECLIGGLVHNFTSLSNGGRGIRAGAGSYVLDCVVRLSGGAGISVGEAAMVEGCVISMSGTDGLLMARLGYALNNFSCGNGINGVGDGIRASSNGCRIESNMVTMNETYGISTDVGGNLIIGNNARNNMVASYNFVGTNTVGPIIPMGSISSTNPWANFAY